jgi:hypothetical protein
VLFNFLHLLFQVVAQCLAGAVDPLFGFGHETYAAHQFLCLLLSQALGFQKSLIRGIDRVLLFAQLNLLRKDSLVLRLEFFSLLLQQILLLQQQNLLVAQYL